MNNNLDPKDADATVDYNVNWGKKHLRGDTILTSDWDVPAGITKESDSHTSGITTIWLSGGTPGENYSLTNQITTAQGRTLEQTIVIRVREV